MQSYLVCSHWKANLNIQEDETTQSVDFFFEKLQYYSVMKTDLSY